MSHAGELESPSPEDSDWRDEAADDESGGNMRNLRVFDRQRGVGMESFTDKGDAVPMIEHSNETYQPGSTLRAGQVGHHHADTSHEKQNVLLANRSSSAP
jgi:hypothetical protein